jgi:hypothetical protein
MALRTQCGLTLLVPANERRIIEMLLGLPEDWPLNEETLEQELDIRAGQKLTLEGIVLGNAAGMKLILVEGLHVGDRPMPAARREVQIFWPGADEIKSLSRPGSQKFEFACHHQRDAVAPVRVTVRELSRQELLDELALRRARLQVRPGNPAEALEYATFPAAEVYDQARIGDPLLVDFTDTVHRPVGRLPDRLEAVPAVRYGREVALPVGAAFRTTERITCLVPANLPTPVAQVAGMVPGETVRVRGQIIGEIMGEKVIRVDYLGFPDTQAADPHNNVWLATVEWPSDPARTLEAWDFGQYRAMDLPCLHRRGRREAVQMVLRQYNERTIRVPADAVLEEEEGDEQDGDDADVIEVE